MTPEQLLEAGYQERSWNNGVQTIEQLEALYRLVSGSDEEEGGL